MSSPYTGEIRMFAGNFAPVGWALCDGQLLAVAGNDALFSLLDTIYGGDGRTTFGLPDLRGRIPMHAGDGTGLTPRAIGAKAGVENAAVNNQQMPSHTHQLKASDDTNPGPDPTGAVLGHPVKTVYRSPFGTPNFNLDKSSLAAAGADQAHANLMPTQCLNFIIALYGVYPSRN
jgi:microcystin-dependent protein